MHIIKLEKKLKTTTPNNSYSIILTNKKNKCVLGSYNQQSNKLILDMWILIHATKQGAKFSPTVLKLIKRVTNAFSSNKNVNIKF